MRLAILGGTGQVAMALRRAAPDATVIARPDADLAQPETVIAALAANPPEAILNAAAYTAVDRAETERELAFTVNAAGPGAVARWAASRGIPFLHVSTDYVFDGFGIEARRPADPTGPLGVYGASKLAGEEAVRGADGPHAILRTSWVFSGDGANFVRTMLRLAATHDSVGVVDDQTGGPTPASGIAAALLAMAPELARRPEATGTWHYAGAPDTTWADFARAVFAEAGLAIEVRGIPTADYPTPAARPANSRLDCAATERVFGIYRPDWRAALTDVVTALQASA